MTADRIAPGLYVGSLADAASGDGLLDAGIGTAVRLTHAPPEDGYPAGVTVQGPPTTDGPRSFSVAAALAVRGWIGLREVFRRVGEARSAAHPYRALVRRAARVLAER